LKLDVLAQHILGMACADPFDAAELHAEIASAYAYRKLTWELIRAGAGFCFDRRICAQDL